MYLILTCLAFTFFLILLLVIKNKNAGKNRLNRSQKTDSHQQSQDKHFLSLSLAPGHWCNYAEQDTQPRA